MKIKKQERIFFDKINFELKNSFYLNDLSLPLQMATSIKALLKDEDFILKEITKKKMKECRKCGEKFNPNSPEKRRAGGLIIHCSECSEEHAVKVVGLSAGDGKQSAISIVSFNSNEDRKQYLQYWARASGMNKGKSCQMHQPGMTAPAVKFNTITKDENRNHKGKL